jgi:phage tail tube protein FII
MNLKSRRDYLPYSYHNGVESISGDKTEGIRAMNNEERDWLNQFNKEFVGASLSKNNDKNLHKVTDEQLKRVAELKKDIRKVKNTIKRMEASTKKYSEEIKEEYRKLHLLEEERVEIDYSKQIYDANNDRNRCTTNIGKMTNKLKFRTMGEMDQNLMNMEEFDDYQDMLYYYNIQLKPDKDE